MTSTLSNRCENSFVGGGPRARIPAKPILIVTYHFPPAPVARSLQLGKLVKYATRAGAKVEVVTLERCGDVKECGFDDNHVQIQPVPAPQRGWLDRLSSAMFSLPFRGWANASIQHALKLVDSRGPDYYSCMMSCAHPMDSHRVGLRIKQTFPSLPWLAHFSDPWATNPYNAFAPWRTIFQKTLEGKVMRLADRVVFVGPELRNFVMRSYPRELLPKAMVLPHVFDPELYETGQQPRASGTDKTRITYVGGLTKQRSSDPFLQVIRTLKAGDAAIDRLELEFVGGQTREAAQMVNRIHPGLAHSTGEVTYVESLKRMQQADALLLIDADMKESPFFPSKLADYLGSGRPVIGISPSCSCSTSMLRNLGMPAYDYDHLDDFAAYLSDVLRGARQFPLMPHEKTARYAADRVAGEFLEMVDSVGSG